MAARIHSRTLGKKFPAVKRLCVSRSPDRARDFVDREGGYVHPGGWQGALADEDVDAVFITTPPSTHADLALQALEAGKYVMVEKPAFLDAESFDRVQEASDRYGRPVMVAENYYYKPLLRRLRQLIADGGLGQIRLMEFNAVKRQHVEGWRVDPALSGGGALFEGGIHWVSLMANLGLNLETAEGFFPDAPPGHEHSAVFVARYAEGAVGVLNYSWEIPSTLKGLRLSRIWGTGGSILFESNGLFAVRTGGLPRPFFPGFRDIQGYRAMMADFLRCIRTGSPPEFTLAQARRDVELVLSAYAGATEQQPYERSAR
jgi:predicted dehydrogenase